MDLLSEPVFSQMDPQVLEQLKAAANPQMSLGEAFALAGVAATNPQMAQQIITNRSSSASNARSVLAQIQGQAASYQKALMLQHMKEQEYERKRQHDIGMAEEGDWQDLLMKMQSEARQSGATLPEVPTRTGDRETDYMARRKWTTESNIAIAEGARQKQIMQEAPKYFEMVSKDIDRMVRNGADPSSMEEGIKASLKLAGAPEVDAQWDTVYKGYARMAMSAARRQQTEFNAEMAHIKAKERKMAADVEVAYDRLASSSRAVTAREISNGMLALDRTADTIRMLDQDIQKMQYDIARFREGGSDLEIAKATALGELLPDKMRTLADLKDAYIRTQNYLTKNMRQTNPAPVIQEVFGANVLSFGISHPSIPDPTKYFAENPNAPEVLAFWDKVVADTLARFPFEDQDAAGEYIEKLGTLGHLNQAFKGQPNFMTQYGAPPAQETPPAE